MRRSLLTLLAATLAPAPAMLAQRPLNLDFETEGVSADGRPWGWTLGWSAFAGGSAARFMLDSAVARSGRSSLRITMDSAGPVPQSIMLQLPAAFALGREIRVSGWTTGLGVAGRALLTLEAWKDRAFAAADTAAIAGSAGWSRHDLAITVPRDSTIHSIVITATLEGPGTVWFDALTLSVDGAPLANLPMLPDPPSDAELAWLSTHAAPLRSVDAPLGSARDDGDLGKFAEIVGSARIVALGESTHGTREFFQVKHRLLEYLVREMGFTVFAIEANQLAVQRINRYVHGGDGTADDVMRVMFQVWNTESMRELIEWMRRHNAARPEHAVRFVGFDMQDHRTPFDSLRAFFARVEPALARALDALLGTYRSEPRAATPHVADSTRARWGRFGEALWHGLQARRPRWLALATDRVDTMQVELALQSANLLRQAARFNVELSSPERDSLMAANLDWVLRTVAPGERAVVWAHDVHVSRGGDPALSFNGGAQMGAYLSRLYGDDYRAFSLLTAEGSYTATASFTDHRIVEASAFLAPPNSLEGALHALMGPGQGIGFVADLRHARVGAASAWLRQPRPIRHVGYAAYDYGFELRAVLPLEFDGVVFIDRTSASRLLR